MGFRIKLRDQTLLLNTINAPVKPTTFKGNSICTLFVENITNENAVMFGC